MSGEPLLIEFHPRPPSGFDYGRHLGVDVPTALRRLLEGGTWTPGPAMGPSVTDQAPLFCYFPDHLWYAIQRRRSDLRYWVPRPGVVSWGNVPVDDPRLLLTLVVGWARRLLKRAVGR